MKAITNISLELENMETIKLANDEVKEFNVADMTDQVTKIGDSILQFRSFSALCAALNAKANHTYNCFGSPSAQTIFQRLTTVADPIGCVTLDYADGTMEQLYVPDDMTQHFEVDEFGNLCFYLGYPEDDDEEDGCCCCGDCEG